LLSSILTAYFSSRCRLSALRARLQNADSNAIQGEPADTDVDAISSAPHANWNLIEIQHEIQQLQGLLESPYLGGAQPSNATSKSNLSTRRRIPISADSGEPSRPPSLPPLINGRVAGGGAVGENLEDWSDGMIASLTAGNSGLVPGIRRTNTSPPLALPTENIGLEPITPEGPVPDSDQLRYQVYSFAAHV
jgi:hypothetical protein